MKKLQSVRGTFDLFPENKESHNFVCDAAKEISHFFGFEEIETPIFEFSEVFSRPLGQSSDVVLKETYNFNDRGGELLTLRPEGTAGLMRAVISNGKIADLPLRYFYKGPMFRYERPQKGRQRQFNQFGIELLGLEDPYSDAEVILCGAEILKNLGILDKCKLNINTLGDDQSRINYKIKLVEYFKKYESSLSLISKQRLKLNPLRILDSKEKEDQEIVKDSPKFREFLSKEALCHFEDLIKFLEITKVSFVINDKLVRGLDYYCHTVFEFITHTLGSQGTILGGGRYDGLSETLSGPKIPGVGFSAGLERLVLMVNYKQSDIPKIAIIPFEERDFQNAFELLFELRKEKYHSEIFQSGNVGKQLKKANKKGFNFVILFGGEEFKKGKLLFKNLFHSSQKELTKDELFANLSKLIE